ncbi:MAG: hybrid sensor histidine kinase/response regulator, partial [Chloroflexi bacterium]|nr:hybrid sensor histidine kinase/response regulator [Chloroflexota bacterium]
RKDGEIRWLRDYGLPEWDAREGRVVRIYGAAEDITERKRAEEERLEMERRLLQAQRLESLGVLAGGVAHDFNNLLMAIRGNLDLALLDLPPASPVRESIEEAARAVQRAADLTRQLLAYAGKGQFVISRVNLSALVEENALLFRAAIPKTVTLIVNLAPDVPAISADAGQIQQVVMNLLTNASEAIGEKPGTITLTTGVMEADAATLARSRLPDPPPAGRYVFLEVADTGCGMDEATIERIFEPF